MEQQPPPHLTLPEGARVWASSDHQFMQELMRKLRGFGTVEEMSELLVARHNALVAPEDVFLHGGDLCMGPFDLSLEYAARLNGIKFLAPGNHDRYSEAFRAKPAYRQRFRRRYEDAGFTLLPERGVTVDIGGHRVLFCHYPFTGDHTDQDRHTELRPKDEGLPLIHGHLHAERRIDGRMFNVGVDANDYNPVSQEEIVAFAESLR